MAVSLPNADDVRKAREQAAKAAAERAEAARTPLYAMLGAGEFAVTAVTKAVTDATKAVADARARATDARGTAGEPGEHGPHRLTDLPQRMSGDELRKFLDELRAQFEKVYAEFAERGEQTWGQLREQPQLQHAVANLKAYTEKLDAHVDSLVDEARDAGEKALGTVSRQTRTAAFPTDVVDTVGAGDTFMAGFLDGLIGREDGLEAALTRGVAAASIVCSRRGAQPPTAAEVDTLVATR